jgi:hypothetical protein
MTCLHRSIMCCHLHRLIAVQVPALHHLVTRCHEHFSSILSIDITYNQHRIVSAETTVFYKHNSLWKNKVIESLIFIPLKSAILYISQSSWKHRKKHLRSTKGVEFFDKLTISFSRRTKLHRVCRYIKSMYHVFNFSHSRSWLEW